jgi:hypothetical protein
VKCSTALDFIGCASKLVRPVGGQPIRSLDKGKRRVSFDRRTRASGELIVSEDRCDVAGTRILERGIALLTAEGDITEDGCRQAAS